MSPGQKRAGEMLGQWMTFSHRGVVNRFVGHLEEVRCSDCALAARLDRPLMKMVNCLD